VSSGSRGTQGIIHTAVDVKSWLRATPSVETVRPAACPRCGEPARPPGRAIGIVGHGLRERQQRGPLTPDAPPVTTVVAARRYVCRGCGGVLVAVPREVLPRKHFAATAIGYAIALFGAAGLSLAEVRRRVSPWRTVGATAQVGWASLRRWLRAARAGQLLTATPCPDDWSLRRVAARVAALLAARAPPALAHLRVEAQAFFGSVHMR
jgi:hypothetical protein